MNDLKFSCTLLFMHLQAAMMQWCTPGYKRLRLLRDFSWKTPRCPKSKCTNIPRRCISWNFSRLLKMRRAPLVESLSQMIWESFSSVTFGIFPLRNPPSPPSKLISVGFLFPLSSLDLQPKELYRNLVRTSIKPARLIFHPIKQLVRLPGTPEREIRYNQVYQSATKYIY